MSDPYDYLPPGLREKVKNRDQRPGYGRRHGIQRWTRGTDTDKKEARKIEKRPWEQDCSGQVVCERCHTFWGCDHWRDATVLANCSRCGSLAECVPCSRYHSSGDSGLHESKMPLAWRDSPTRLALKKWLCHECRPSHIPDIRAELRVCENEDCSSHQNEEVRYCVHCDPTPYRPSR